MALINKNHPDIAAANGRNKVFLTVDDTKFFFTKAAGTSFGLIPGKYLQFINEGEEWFFYQDENPDGFKIYADHKKNGAVYIVSIPLVKIFRKSLGVSDTQKYFFAPADRKSNGIPMFEIFTKKTYEQIIKES